MIWFCGSGPRSTQVVQYICFNHLWQESEESEVAFVDLCIKIAHNISASFLEFVDSKLLISNNRPLSKFDFLFWNMYHINKGPRWHTLPVYCSRSTAAVIYYCILSVTGLKQNWLCSNIIYDLWRFLFLISENISLFLFIIFSSVALASSWKPLTSFLWGYLRASLTSIFSWCYNDESVGLTEFNYINIEFFWSGIISTVIFDPAVGT